MRFITHHLTSIKGVEIFPLLSLCIFVGFFALVIIRVWRMTKTESAQMSEMPLNDGEPINTSL